MTDPLVERIRRGWKFARTLTFDMLRHLDGAELLFEPGGGLGPFWKQFRHLGRIQQNYMDALETGKIDFGVPEPGYTGGPVQSELLQYLGELDRSLYARLDALDPFQPVVWFGRSIDAIEHLTRLINHETMHHGEFVAYVGFLGKRFPPAWKSWGL